MPKHLSRSHKAYNAYKMNPEAYRGIGLYKNRRIVLLRKNDSFLKRTQQFFLKLFGQLKCDYHSVHCYATKWKTTGRRRMVWNYDEGLSPELNQCLQGLYQSANQLVNC